MEARPRAAVWASSFAIAVFQVVGSFGAAQNQPERQAVDVLAVVLLLVGPAALTLRQTRPLLAAAVAIGAVDVYVGLGYAYGPIFMSVVVALFSAVQYGARRRATWLLAACGYVGFVVAVSLDPRNADGPGLVHLALVAGWLAVVLAVSDVVRVRRDQAVERARAEHEERQRRVSEQRLALAQELHDVLAHNISLINVQASVALHLLDERPDQARPALANVKAASRDALHELRTALDVLRRGDAAPRSPAPRLADLDALVSGVRATGLSVRLDLAELPPLPGAVELAAYRIVQEALTNVTRHAHATSATVRVSAGNDVTDEVTEVTVEVTDDGAGQAGPAGSGIEGMRQRAAALGGTVDAGPRPGGGFRVLARLPVPTS